MIRNRHPTIKQNIKTVKWQNCRNYYSPPHQPTYSHQCVYHARTNFRERRYLFNGRREFLISRKRGHFSGMSPQNVEKRYDFAWISFQLVFQFVKAGPKHRTSPHVLHGYAYIYLSFKHTLDVMRNMTPIEKNVLSLTQLLAFSQKGYLLNLISRPNAFCLKKSCFWRPHKQWFRLKKGCFDIQIREKEVPSSL